jgi:hypothetical protein
MNAGRDTWKARVKEALLSEKRMELMRFIVQSGSAKSDVQGAV